LRRSKTWLSRLRRGLEKIPPGFCLPVVDTLGDDPLTPEFSTIWKPSCCGPMSGLQGPPIRLLEALRQRLNIERLVDLPRAPFLKEQPARACGAPITASGQTACWPPQRRFSFQCLAFAAVNGVRQSHHPGQSGQPCGAQRLQLSDSPPPTLSRGGRGDAAGHVWGERSGPCRDRNQTVPTRFPPRVGVRCIGDRPGQAAANWCLSTRPAGCQDKHQLDGRRLAKVRASSTAGACGGGESCWS